MKPLVGNWNINYPVYAVASLDKDQAMALLYGSRHGDPFDSWVLYDVKDLKVTIDYPLRKPVTFTVKAEIGYDGEPCLNFGAFLLEVAKKYKEIYRKPAKYGIWGHCLEDLAFESVTVKKNWTVELGIGS